LEGKMVFAKAVYTDLVLAENLAYSVAQKMVDLSEQ
jgi:hypothetical protein